MSNKMMHRGSMTRLAASTSTNLPVLSTCLLLFIQIQIFHALPTTTDSLSDSQNGNNNDPGTRASLTSSSTYGSAYPYSSYRPGARLDSSYRPYSGYNEKITTGNPSGLYLPVEIHPNSVYSRQSVASSASAPQELEKVLELIEREIEASDLKLEDNDKKASTIRLVVGRRDNQQAVAPPGEKKISGEGATTTTAVFNNNASQQLGRNNKPRLLPLPSISVRPLSSSGIEDDTKVKQQQQPVPTEQNSAEQKTRSVDYSPVPPPFAPELDPLYERRQYGLGALTLLDQAGPFW